MVLILLSQAFREFQMETAGNRPIGEGY